MLLIPLLSTAMAVMAAPPTLQPHYTLIGAWNTHFLCGSPLWFRGKKYWMASKIDEPSMPGHSHFCLHDGATGESLSCSGKDHFFFSSIVDHTGNSTAEEKIWVFGSAWNRANRSAESESEAGDHDRARARSNTSGWGSGPCAAAAQGKGAGCEVGAWSSSDLKTWTYSKILTLPLPFTVPNVGAGMIPRKNQPTPARGLPRHQAFMALEDSKASLAVNTGSGGNLHSGWELLPYACAAENCTSRARGGSSPPFAGTPAAHGGFGLACPSARYNADDGYYYVFGGGVSPTAACLLARRRAAAGCC